MKNYALDKSLLPQVWLTWLSTKNKEFHKRYWLNCQNNIKKDRPASWMNYTGESSSGSYPKWTNWSDLGGFGISATKIDNGKIWIAANSKLYLTYAKYHPDIERLELAVVKFDTKRNFDGERWGYARSRFFIGKDKTIVDEKGNAYQGKMYIDEDPWHYAYNGRQLLGLLLRNCTTTNFLNEFKKFIGAEYFNIGNGSSVKIEYPYDVKKWYETVQKERSTSKRQQFIDKLTEIPLSDCSDLHYKYPTIMSKDRWGYDVEASNIVYFERVNDEWSVLRHFIDGKTENWRVYIENKNKIIIVSKDRQGWVSSKQQKNSWRCYSYLANPEDAIEKCPRIKYILSSMKDVELHNTVDLLVTALRFPEIEQLIKFGYDKLAMNAVQDSFTKARLKDMFGGYYNDKGTNLLRKIGLTKKQFDISMQKEEYAHLLTSMRRLFGEDLSYMDIESFEKYINACQNIRQTCGYRDLFRTLENCLGEDKDLNLRIFKNAVRLSKKEPRVYSIITDTLNSYRGLRTNTRPTIDWCFDDVSDVIRAHDAIIRLKQIQDEERQAYWNADAAERRKREDAKRKKIDEERKCYEYEDDKYIIRLPKDSAEIVSEGNLQHICIGGYTTRHAFGETNLFFLRQKGREDIPFYAIEMNNSKVINQIHGFGNRWLGNDPDAIPTVIRWLRKHGIKCEDKILTCKATGYSGYGDCVPMPVVD